jgi:hypothetical protein
MEETLLLFEVWTESLYRVLHEKSAIVQENFPWVKFNKAIPLQAWTGPEGSEGWSAQISRQSAHKGVKVVGPTHRPPLPQEIFLVLICVRGWVDPRRIVRPEGLGKWKIPVTSLGIEAATFRLLAQCRN